MHISIDFSEQTPIYEQITASITRLINEGKLRQGDRLPTVRQLAQDLGVNLNTVARAYRDLANKDVLSVRQGRGATVFNTKGRCNPATRKKLKRMTAHLANEAVLHGIGAQELHALIDTELRGIT